MSTPRGLNPLERIWFMESVHSRLASLPERTRAHLSKLILEGRHRPALGFDLLESRLNLSTVVSLAETPVEIDPMVMVSVPADAAVDPRSLPVQAGPGDNEIVEWIPPAEDPRDMPVYAGPGINEVVDSTLGDSSQQVSSADPQGVFLSGVGASEASSSRPISAGDALESIPLPSPPSGGPDEEIAGIPQSFDRTRPDDGTAPPTPSSVELKPASSSPVGESVDETVEEESGGIESKESTKEPTPEDSSAAGPMPDFEPDELIPMLFDLVDLSQPQRQDTSIDEIISQWVAEGGDGSIPVLIHATENGIGSALMVDDIPINDEDGSLGYLAALGASAVGALTWASRPSRQGSNSPESRKPKDARRHERTALRENVELLARHLDEVKSDRSIAVSRDVSRTGMGILHSAALEGNRVQLSYPDHGNLVTRWGIVRWTTRLAARVYMSGIEFESESAP